MIKTIHIKTTESAQCVYVVYIYIRVYDTANYSVPHRAWVRTSLKRSHITTACMAGKTDQLHTFFLFFCSVCMVLMDLQ